MGSKRRRFGLGGSYHGTPRLTTGPLVIMIDSREEAHLLIVYDGTYSWKGNRTTRKRPISWWRSSYQLRIVDVSRGAEDVVFIKPHVVLFADTGRGASVTNCLPDLAKQVCEDFNLDLDRVMWVEDRPDIRERFRVAMLRPVVRLKDDTFYQVDWRPPAPGERQLIENLGV